jgi:hypothetical protein
MNGIQDIMDLESIERLILKLSANNELSMLKDVLRALSNKEATLLKQHLSEVNFDGFTSNISH